jgi:hypothetical protein
MVIIGLLEIGVLKFNKSLTLIMGVGNPSIREFVGAAPPTLAERDRPARHDPTDVRDRREGLTRSEDRQDLGLVGGQFGPQLGIEGALRRITPQAAIDNLEPDVEVSAGVDQGGGGAHRLITSRGPDFSSVWLEEWGKPSSAPSASSAIGRPLASKQFRLLDLGHIGLADDADDADDTVGLGFRPSA